MRLIDADALKNKICEKWFIEILSTQTYMPSISENLEHIIKNQPIAYDVDRVVEEMRKLKRKKVTPKDVHWNWCLECCIQIVKAGGIVDRL